MNAPPLLDTRIEVEPAWSEQVAKRGFVQLARILPADSVRTLAAALPGELDALRDPDAGPLVAVPNAWRQSSQVRTVVFSRRLAHLAAELLGVRSVRLLRDELISAEPGNGFAGWHADQYDWPLSSDRVASICIPLQDVPPVMGPLGFAAGSHLVGYGRPQPAATGADGGTFDEHQFEIYAEPPSVGDLTLHLGWTYYQAGCNDSDGIRRTLTVVYMDSDIRLAPPADAAQTAQVRRWMPAARVGQVPDTPLNPVLYRSPIA